MATDMLKDEYNNPQMENDKYEKLICQQKDYLVSLDREITAAEGKIQEKLTFPGGILKQQGRHKYLRKHIDILENKLKQAAVEFNELMCLNMDDRKDMAHLLQLKGAACNIEEKLNRQIAKLEERLTLASNQRSEAEARLLEARERIEVAAVQFTKRRMPPRARSEVIDHDAKLYTFMERKLQRATPLGDNEDSKKRKKEQQHQNRVKELEMYKQAHSRLQEVTGERDLRQIGRMFIQTEQKNFALLDYVNELHNRSNALKNSTNKMKSEILLLEQENKGHDEQRESQLKDLGSELERYICLADSMEKQRTEVQRTLDQLKTAISGLLKEIMHKAAIVTSDNITHSISILEESINHLLIQANDVEDEDNLLLANSDLLPECEAVVETEYSRTPSRSLKSA